MRKSPFNPLLLQFHPQRSTSDCGIASLATYLGLPYEHVLIAAGAVGYLRVPERGVFLLQLQKIARKLGRPLTALSPLQYSLEESVGILHVARDQTGDIGGISHLVVLCDGSIYDPEEHQWWRDASVYLASRHLEARNLLVHVDKTGSTRE